MVFEDIQTFADADEWLNQEPGKRGVLLDPADAVAALVADALRQRGAIDPESYAAVWGNHDYITDDTLMGDLRLSDLERLALQMTVGGQS